MTFTQRTVSDETIFPTKYGESVGFTFLQRRTHSLIIMLLLWPKQYRKPNYYCYYYCSIYLLCIVRKRRPRTIDWCWLPFVMCPFSANEFPSSFESIVRKILRLLYHVVAHIYHSHFRDVAELGLHAHLNCVFAHLTLLNQRFNLIDPKETEILGDLEAALLGK